VLCLPTLATPARSGYSNRTPACPEHAEFEAAVLIERLRARKPTHQGRSYARLAKLLLDHVAL